MNGLVRLGMTSPLENLSGLPEGGQPLPGYVDAFAEVFTGALAIGDGEETEGSGGDENEHYVLSFENVEQEKEVPASLIYDNKLEDRHVVTQLPAHNEDVARTIAPGIVVDEIPPVTPPVQEAGDNRLMSNENQRSLANITDPQDGSSQRDALGLFADDGPVHGRAKGQAVSFPDTIIPKTMPLLPGAALVKPDGLQREPKAGPAQDSLISSLRPLVNSNPVTKAEPSAFIPIVPVTTPPVTVAETAMPRTAPAAATTAPILPVLDMQAGNQWIARLNQDIGQLSADKPELFFQLKPENLGKLSVRITTDAAGDIVRMETENENVKALLIGSQARLEHDIRLSGLKLARVDVTVQDQSGSQLDQHSSGSRDSGAGADRHGELQSRLFGTQQNPVGQKDADLTLQNSAGASSPHGARYA